MFALRLPRARAITIAASLALAAALLVYSLRGIDWREAGRIIAGADLRRIAIALALASVTTALRGWRWRTLLAAGGPVCFSDAFWANAAGSFANNFLPVRAGEIVRSVMIARRTGFETSFVLATALSERVADAITLVVVSAAVLVIVPEGPGWLSSAVRPFAIAGLAGALAIAVVPLLGATGRRLIERAPLPHAVRPKAMAAMEHGLRGVATLHDRGRLVRFAILTAAIWYLDALGTAIAASALGFGMPLTVAFLLLAGLGLGSALPSAPGYVGIFQFVAVTVLVPFGYSRTDAIAFILVAQVLGYVVIGFWGALGFWRYRTANGVRPDTASRS